VIRVGDDAERSDTEEPRIGTAGDDAAHGSIEEPRR
jgi:hypothetical protein